MGAMASQITQPFVQTQIKENIKAPRRRPLCGEFTGGRWISRTKGPFDDVNRLNARFPFVSSGVKGHLLQTYCCSFYGCQTWDLYGKHINQLNVEWNKAVWRTLNLPYKTHRRLLPLIVNGKSFKSQHCSRLHKYVNGFFSSENIYVSFIGAKAKTRVTGSLGRNWARLAGHGRPCSIRPSGWAHISSCGDDKRITRYARRHKWMFAS